MVLWSQQHSQAPAMLYLCWWADPGSRPWWSCKWHDAPQEQSVVRCAGRAAVNVLRTQNRHVAEMYIHVKWRRKQTLAQTNFLGCLADLASGKIGAYNEWNLYFTCTGSVTRMELPLLPRAAQSHWNGCPADLILSSGRSGWDSSALLSFHASFHSVSRAAFLVARACFHCSNPEISFVLPKEKGRAKVLGETRR